MPIAPGDLPPRITPQLVHENVIPDDPRRTHPQATNPGAPVPAFDAGAMLNSSVIEPSVIAPAGGATPPVPHKEELNPLFGGADGIPLAVSNNPEIVTSSGVLFTNAKQPDGLRAATTPLQDAMIYLHHIMKRPGGGEFSLVVTNPNQSAIELEVEGVGLSQNNTDGLALGNSPDFKVTDAWVRGTTKKSTHVIEPMKAQVVWTASAGFNREVDGLFHLEADAPYYVYVVAHGARENPVAQTKKDANGKLWPPGDGRLGRSTGVYEGSTWTGRAAMNAPPVGKRISFSVNDAGQALSGIAVPDDSAPTAIGMYGAEYRLELAIHNPGPTYRKVRVSFASIGGGNPSRYWDGLASYDGRPVHIEHTPNSRTTELETVTIAPGESHTVSFNARVPGLAAIPQALSIETLPGR